MVVFAPRRTLTSSSISSFRRHSSSGVVCDAYAYGNMPRIVATAAASTWLAARGVKGVAGGWSPGAPRGEGSACPAPRALTGLDGTTPIGGGGGGGIGGAAGATATGPGSPLCSAATSGLNDDLAIASVRAPTPHPPLPTPAHRSVNIDRRRRPFQDSCAARRTAQKTLVTHGGKDGGFPRGVQLGRARRRRECGLGRAGGRLRQKCGNVGVLAVLRDIARGDATVGGQACMCARGDQTAANVHVAARRGDHQRCDGQDGHGGATPSGGSR